MEVLPKPTQISHFTPIYVFLLFFFHLHYPIYSLNITQILSNYPNLSKFTALLTATGISNDINNLTNVTILAVPNTYLPPTSPSSLPDVIRCHVLLQYLTWPDLREPHPTLIPTLLKPLNVTFNDSTDAVSFHVANNNSSSSNVLTFVETVPFRVSVLTVDSLLNPTGFDLTASNMPAPSEVKVNITDALINGHNFNVAASMITASGVVSEFERDEDGAGITFFVPTDVAFANLPPRVELQALPADKKYLVLKFHVLHSYYPLGSLELIVNPAQPTLATEANGAGSFTLGISRVNGSVLINTGVSQAVVTQTVFDQKPVAIFGVSNVLLPKEIFGKGGEVDLGGGNKPVHTAQPPDIGTEPESRPYVEVGGPSHAPLVSAAAAAECGQGGDVGRWVVILSCIAALLCVL
ncbi:fasciclin-like arabinogalactan protein 4 [Silene latifolia]|uniref:fasciclin-like arabinogalactan protein 4 n=1 Tax=Silene latifolia TaxID=37657 RepID=UPI003D785FBA